MSTFRKLFVPIAALFVLAGVSVFTRAGGFLYFLSATALMVPALSFGRRLQQPFRVFITGVVFILGFELCLSARVMGAGLTHYTFGMAISAFTWFAALLVLPFLRMWPLRSALLLIVAALPVCLGLALVTAEIEERTFIYRHGDSGIGPTPRWTDRNSWLSYDPHTQRLSGAD